MSSSDSKQGAGSGLILTFIVCFFPIGLYLVWKHPQWTTQKKWMWTGGFVIFLSVANYMASLDKAAIQAEIAKADVEWQQDNRVTAVDTYRRLLENDFFHVAKEEGPRLFRRVIEFDVESGNVELARRFIALARSKDVSLSLESSQARLLLAESATPEPATQDRAIPEPENSTSVSDLSKLEALQSIVSKLSDFPDRFAGDSERTQFNSEVEEMIKAFEKISFDAAATPDEARSIVELYEEKIQNRYSGLFFKVLHEDVAQIMQDLLNR